jgi:hypothetical protein
MCFSLVGFEIYNKPYTCVYIQRQMRLTPVCYHIKFIYIYLHNMAFHSGTIGRFGGVVRRGGAEYLFYKTPPPTAFPLEGFVTFELSRLADGAVPDVLCVDEDGCGFVMSDFGGRRLVDERRGAAWEHTAALLGRIQRRAALLPRTDASTASVGDDGDGAISASVSMGSISNVSGGGANPVVSNGSSSGRISSSGGSSSSSSSSSSNNNRSIGSAASASSSLVAVLLARGVPDRRAAVSPGLIEEMFRSEDFAESIVPLLKYGEETLDDLLDHLSRIESLYTTLAESGLPDSVDHGDLHAGNVAIRLNPGAAEARAAMAETATEMTETEIETATALTETETVATETTATATETGAARDLYVSDGKRAPAPRVPQHRPARASALTSGSSLAGVPAGYVSNDDDDDKDQGGIHGSTSIHATTSSAKDDKDDKDTAATPPPPPGAYAASYASYGAPSYGAYGGGGAATVIPTAPGASAAAAETGASRTLTYADSATPGTATPGSPSGRGHRDRRRHGGGSSGSAGEDSAELNGTRGGGGGGGDDDDDDLDRSFGGARSLWPKPPAAPFPGRIVIFDWADASIAHPLLTVAHLASERSRRRRDADRLFSAYLSAWVDADPADPTALPPAALHLDRIAAGIRAARVLTHLHQALVYWWLVQHEPTDIERWELDAADCLDAALDALNEEERREAHAERGRSHRRGGRRKRR